MVPYLRVRKPYLSLALVILSGAVVLVATARQGALLATEQSKLLLDCLRAVMGRDPRVALVLTLDFFKNKTNEAIARELGTTVRTVTRCKQKGLDYLREELKRRGVHSVDELPLVEA